MEYKELKKSVQLELNEEMLGTVAGGNKIAETWNPLPTTASPGVIFDEPCVEDETMLIIPVL